MSVAVAAGKSVSLECVTGKSAPPAITQWYKDGAPFVNGSHKVALFGSVGDGGAIQSTLALEFVAAPWHVGSYTCVATNPLSGKTVISNTATVIVNRKYNP